MMRDETKVKRGIALLDKKLGKHWPSKINRSQLEMFNCNKCILGQLFGRYENGLLALGFRQLGSDATYGFDGSVDENTWREALRGRR